MAFHFLKLIRLIIPVCLTLQPAPVKGEIQFRGVSLAGAEFFSSKLPGTYGVDYRYPASAEADYFVGQDMNLIRLPFRWERLQRTLYGPFDAAEQERIVNFVQETTAKGAHVILDVHNYARYGGNVIGSAAVPLNAFVDFNSRLATLFKNNQRVIFGLMNEPHDIPSEQWRDAANAGLAAIRTAGAAQLVLVSGNGYSIGSSWSQGASGTSNAVVMLGIVDPGNNFAFEIHQYLDADSSGANPQAVSATIGSQRLAAVNSWLRQNGRRGFLGETGGGSDAVTLAAISDILKFVETNNDVWVGWSVWAAGSLWPTSYPFLLSPTAAGADRPQMASLQANIPPIPPSLQYSTATAQVSFLSRNNYKYRLQTSGELENWSFAGPLTAGTGGLIQLQAPQAGSRRFFRLQVTK